MYINGIQEDTDTGAGNIDSLSNANNFEVGDVDGANTETANGLLAYIFQSTSVLTIVEITELMWKPGSLPSNGYWPMYGGDSPEQDLSGNNNDGTVTGATTSDDGPPIMIGDQSL